MTGNADIAVHGREHAALRRAKSDERLAAAKLEIEAGIKDGTIDRVTAQDVLRRAGLKPHFLSKPSRANTNAALKIWIGQQNGTIGRASRSASSQDEGKQALSALREQFVALQNAYAKDALVGVSLARELREERIKSGRLAKENADLRARLRSAGLDT